MAPISQVYPRILTRWRLISPIVNSGRYSLIGHDGITLQHQLINVISKTDVRLIVPSKFGSQYNDQGDLITVNHEKIEVSERLKKLEFP
ncbi:uncharacterized protein N7529_000809 [Penicillium soppii]|uniref:uncharacterized protein n=1 Tax=Penicillium soppii TaxID=69789 RepID=UPI0025497DA6|nr:uncharacterized protein N7529_000809 [Penicillium soppii]KAJ5882137.1 hypothetical protein N7529_000809 [Penicillium soppii]